MLRRNRMCGRGGFSLIEVAVATVIIGLGVVALVATTMSNTRTNDAGKKYSQAVFLAQEIREWTLKLPFSDPDPGDQDNPPGPDGSDPQTFVDDLDDLMTVTYNPPRDGQGTAIADLAGWSQTITMTWLNADNLAQTVNPGTSDVVLVSVTITYQGTALLTTSWLVTRTQ